MTKKNGIILIKTYIIRLMVNKSTCHWLRIEYTKKYESPVTFIKVVECEYESPNYLVTFHNIS